MFSTKLLYHSEFILKTESHTFLDFSMSLHINEDTEFFFGHQMPLSNFYKCHFNVQLPQPYGWCVMNSVEQLYMFRKALYFDDYGTCLNILLAPNARVVKSLGSKVKHFVSCEWKKVKNEVMKECLVRKFTDSEEKTTLKHILLESRPILVEANPKDKYWGIGFSKYQAQFIQKENWAIGENWLGKLLMWLRDYLENMEEKEQTNEETHGFKKIESQVYYKHLFEYNRQHLFRNITDDSMVFHKQLNYKV